MENEEQIRAVIQRAQAATEGLDDSLKPIAFRVVLESLLRDQESSSKSAMSAAAAQSKGTTSIPANLNEFLATKTPKSHIDRVTAIAFYSLHSGDETGVTVDEVLDGYARTRIAKPKNIHDVVAQCVRRGFLIEAASRKDGVKAWVITPTGENYVDNDFQIMK